MRVSSTWGDRIKLSLFGESHGPAVGIVIDGLPAGLEIDMDRIKLEMRRRAPGRDQISSSRSERDEFEILSGYFKNRTTGTALTVVIENTNTRSKDYERTKDLIRPGHADYTGHKKYRGYNDYRGGGHFSARLTAPIVFAGAIAKQILEKKGIVIGSHIKSIGDIEDVDFQTTDISLDLLETLSKSKLATIERAKAKEMEEKILAAKQEGDSLGGVVELVALNLPVGLGEPFFDSLESKLASIIFSIPGVKGLEFGEGFDIARMKGSKANDEFYLEDEKIKTYTNHSGGVLGGIANGMPLIFKVAFKPTPSIAKTQRTVDINKLENTNLEIRGRHDPCIVPRGLVVLEAVTALAILDLIMNMEN